MNYKQYLKIYFILVISTIVIFFSSLYIYDPLQVFHKNWFTKELHLNNNMRIQSAGILNNYEYDSLILGSSLFENTSSEEASKLLDGEFINISLSGAGFYERKIFLNYALQKKKIKKVLYSMDPTYVNLSTHHRNYPIETFDFLYDMNPFNDFKIYFNDRYLKCLLKFSQSNKCIGSKTSLDMPNSWFKQKRHSIRYGGIKNWFKMKHNKKMERMIRQAYDIKNIMRTKKVVTPSSEKLALAKRYVDENLLLSVSKNPNTEFKLVFPPYSRLQFLVWKYDDVNTYEIYKYILKYLANQTEKYKNMKLYGFEKLDFIDDLKYYRDFRHFHYTINSAMLTWIRSENGLIDKNNVDTYLKNIDERLINYDVESLHQVIKKEMGYN